MRSLIVRAVVVFLAISSWLSLAPASLLAQQNTFLSTLPPQAQKLWLNLQDPSAWPRDEALLEQLQPKPAEEFLERLGGRFDELTAKQFDTRQSRRMSQSVTRASNEVTEVQHRNWTAQASALGAAIKDINKSLDQLSTRRKETLQAIFGSVIVAFRLPNREAPKAVLKDTQFAGREDKLVIFKQVDFNDVSVKYSVVLYYYSMLSLSTDGKTIAFSPDTVPDFYCVSSPTDPLACGKDEAQLFSVNPSRDMRQIVQEALRALIEESHFKNNAAKAGYSRLDSEFGTKEQELRQSKEDLCKQYRYVIKLLGAPEPDADCTTVNIPDTPAPAPPPVPDDDTGLELFVHSTRHFEYTRPSDPEKEKKLVATRRDEAKEDLREAIDRQVATIQNLLDSTSRDVKWGTSISRQLLIVSPPSPTERYENDSVVYRRTAMQVSQVLFQPDPPRLPSPNPPMTIFRPTIPPPGPPAPPQPTPASDGLIGLGPWRILPGSDGRPADKSFSELTPADRSRLPSVAKCQQVGPQVLADPMVKDYLAHSEYQQPQFWVAPDNDRMEALCRLDPDSGWRSFAYEVGTERASVILQRVKQ